MGTVKRWSRSEATLAQIVDVFLCRAEIVGEGWRRFSFSVQGISILVIVRYPHIVSDANKFKYGAKHFKPLRCIVSTQKSYIYTACIQEGIRATRTMPNNKPNSKGYHQSCLMPNLLPSLSPYSSKSGPPCPSPSPATGLNTIPCPAF